MAKIKNPMSLVNNGPYGTIILPDYMKQISAQNGCFYQTENMPQEINFIGRGLVYTESVFRFAPSNLHTIHITFSDNCTSISSMCERSYNIQNIYFEFNTSHIISWYRFPSSYTKNIYGELDFTSATQDGSLPTALTGIDLRTITVKPNTLSINFSLSQASLLSETSLLSVANCLKDGVSGKTLTLHATPKARCATLMGTVSLDPTSTYHIFTADDSGDTSLEEFIVSVKGWSLS